jgi:branched-chain amino acid transport system permease protein
VITVMLINLILVVGLYIFVGNSGVLSFGHMSFMAVGAYASALLTIPIKQKHFILPNLPPWLAQAEVPTVVAAVVAGLVAMAIALVLSVPLMRLNGIAAGIATFALLVITQVVLSNWDTVTRGTETMLGLPIDTTLYSALAWSLISIVAAYLFRQSRVGLRLRASREDETAAHALGTRVIPERSIAFAVSAFFVAVGGALYGHLYGSFSPDAFYITLTFTTFTMLVIGGINTLAGAVVGTVGVTTLSQLLLQIESGISLGTVSFAAPAGFHEVALAVLMLVVLIVRPQGITGGKEFVWPGSGMTRRAATQVTSHALPPEEKSETAAQFREASR